MIVLGLTGSIGMGKSATADMFRAQGVPVHDADATVHQLYAPGGAAVPLIEKAFPGTTSEEGGVDRNALRAQVINDSAAVKRLEAVVHPLVRDAKQAFLETHKDAGQPIVVLDVPLLFETGGDGQVDYVLVVSAPEHVQRERVLQREGMTEAVFDAILAKQTPDSIKREKADFVIDTSQGFDHARDEVTKLIETLKDKSPD